MSFLVTFRVDSDLMMIYGALVDNKTGKFVAPARNVKWKDYSSTFFDKKLLSKIKNKTKDFVWMSSNCNAPSRRNELAHTLSKYIQVDNLGSCGTRYSTKATIKLIRCHP